MSTKTTRRYRKRRRAELEEETRRRITEAAVELHRSVGPARTTISAIADRAGVQRATVYRHFPDELSLFSACSAHYQAANPPPDPGMWNEVGDPDERAAIALAQLYDWYARTEAMLENVTRDRALVPPLDKVMDDFGRYYDAAAEVLLERRPERGRRRKLARAAIGHALEYETWRSLVRRQGLGRDEAVEMGVRLIRCSE